MQDRPHLFGRHIEQGGDCRFTHSQRMLAYLGGHQLGKLHFGNSAHLVHHPLRASAMMKRGGIEYFSSPEGAVAGGASNHEPVAALGHAGGRKVDLHQAALAAAEAVAVHQVNPPLCFVRAQQELSLAPQLQGRSLFKECKPPVNHTRLFQRSVGHDHAAPEVTPLKSHQVDRRPVAGTNLRHLAAVTFEAPDTKPAVARKKPHRLLHAKPAAGHRTGDHGAETGHRENAIDVHAEDVSPVALTHPAGDRANGSVQLIDSFSGYGRYRQNIAALKKCPLCQLANFLRGQLTGRLIDKIRLGQCRHTVGHPQHLHDSQMFPGLRHHPFICGHHQEGEIDADRSADHGMYEISVPGHIDHTQRIPRGQPEMGKTEVDGNTASFFLLVRVAVDTAERLDQRGLAVIDMTGGTHDEMFHAMLRARAPAPDRGLS